MLIIFLKHFVEKKNNMNYKNKILKNSIIMFICFMVQTILGFVVRKIFIDSLGTVALGYNAVFTNILTLLNLSELGIGIAVNAFLYKVIVNNDRERLNAIYSVLKRLYIITCIMILIFSLIIAIFLPVFISNMYCNSIYIYTLYFLSIGITLTSYLAAHRRTIIISDQKNFVVTSIECFSYIVSSLLQIFVLIIFKSYIGYLIIGIIKNLISVSIINIYFKKKYSYLNGCSDDRLKSDYHNSIIGEMKNIFIAKIASAIFHGTDSIIISAILGTIYAGLMSNYLLFTTTIQNLIFQVFYSVQATIGNFVHSNNSVEDKERVYKSSFFVSFILAVLALEGTIYVVPKAISIFFGDGLLLPISVPILLGINLFLIILLQVPNQIFTIYKLYKYDKYIVSFSAILNIIISIILVYIIGINGVLVGTTITTVIYLISRCYIIKKRIYPNVDYMNIFLKYILSAFVITIVIYFSDFLNAYNNFIMSVVLNTFFILVVSLVLIAMLFIKNDSFSILIKKVFNFSKNK